MAGLRADGGQANGADGTFVERHAELALLGAAMQAVRLGAPRLVVVEGRAGIGKTMLVRQLLRSAGNVHVLGADCDEAEAHLPLAVVGRLTAAAVSRYREAAPLTDAEADPLRVGADLLELLHLLQQRRPVLLVIDGVEWADGASLRALTYAVRRLRSGRLLVLFVTRNLDDPRLPDGLRRQLDGDGGLHLQLSGLDMAGLRALAARLGAGVISPRVAARLHDHTQGNPGYARALLQEFPVDALDPAAVAPLPAPRSVALETAERLAACSPETRRLVDAAAVLGRSCTLGLAAGVAQVAAPLTALESALQAQLLEERSSPDQSIGFPHPLVHAAVYRSLGPASRAALHGRAATLVEGDAARLRHRAAAAGTPDAGLAAELAAFARRQALTGTLSTASDHLLAAARLAPGPPQRDQLRLEATECGLLVGDGADQATPAGQLRELPVGPWRDYLLGLSFTIDGRLSEGARTLAGAWRGSGDPALRARIAGQMAVISLLQGRGDRAARWAERALSLAPDQPAADLAWYARLVGLGMAGRSDEGLALGAGLPDPAVASPPELGALLGRGLLRTWTDDFAGAYRDLSRVVTAGRERSAGFRVLAALLAGWAALRLGRWDEGLTHLETALSVSSDTGQRWLAPFGHALAVLPLAGRGRWEAAVASLRAAREASELLDNPAAAACTAAAAAQLAAARGDHAGVVGALQPLQGPQGCDRPEPGVLDWRDLLADALVALGECQAAAAVLAPTERWATSCHRSSSILVTARARGNLEAARGNPDAAEAAFRLGLQHVRRVQLPFEHAQLRLAFGRFLRRIGRRGPAATELHTSAELFAALGARPYLERCERELAACGMARWQQPVPDAVQLTPQERAVAQLVGAGLSNRQVARELVVSVKTVEYHLSNAYAKLGLTSRSQLVLLLARDWGFPQVDP